MKPVIICRGSLAGIRQGGVSLAHAPARARAELFDPFRHFRDGLGNVPSGVIGLSTEIVDRIAGAASATSWMSSDTRALALATFLVALPIRVTGQKLSLAVIVEGLKEGGSIDNLAPQRCGAACRAGKGVGGIGHTQGGIMVHSGAPSVPTRNKPDSPRLP
ncbi:hypothetical protein [Salipiger aestuarii]|uniref:hypothetical protein n=1 Tax=Salipiger aestuarii TaxID=568098 RepID=UPI00123B464D|nr:hypothetical protein [Salipiger aestuarii]